MSDRADHARDMIRRWRSRAASSAKKSMTEPEPGMNREELERGILGETPGLTREAVAEAAGVDLEQARRLWRALGFPDVVDAAAFTDADLVALGTLARAVEQGSIDFDTAVRLTPAVGQTMGPRRRPGG